MKAFLLNQEIDAIHTRIREFEKNTGTELLVIVAQQSDEYPAAPWRFGILFGLATTLCFAQFYEFHQGHFWPILMMMLTLLGTFIGRHPGAKKLALSDSEVDRETFEKALECFHSMGTSRVSHKTTAMIMVSILERKIHVLVDDKLKTQISQNELDELVTIMRSHFKLRAMGDGFIRSIESLEEKILKDFGGKVSDVNPAELKDQIIFI
jgi:uncharacterized membrane protein